MYLRHAAASPPVDASAKRREAVVSNLPTGTTDADIDRAFGSPDECDEWCPTCEGRRPGLLYNRREFVCDGCGETTWMDE